MNPKTPENNDLKKLLCILFLVIILSINSGFTQDNENIFHRVFLTANTADISSSSAFVNASSQLLAATSENFTFVINGDLVPGKITDNTSGPFTTKIQNILEPLVKYKNGKIVIIPGDRDWADSGKDGWKSVRKLEKIIKEFGYENVKWAVKKGCPGPNLIGLTDNLYLVAISTQWWNHPYDKPGPADADCKISTTDDFKEELEDIIDDEKGKNLLIAGHYPIISLGEYGGNFSLRSHLFPLTDLSDVLYLPLPIVGSLYPSYRKNIGTTKDISNEHFENFRRLLGNIISHRQSLIYVSGHEHNLQLLRRDKNYFINSGAPDKTGYAAGDGDALYSDSKPGLMELIYYDDGRIVSRVHSLTKEGLFVVDSRFELYQSGCDDLQPDIPVNDLLTPCREEVAATETMGSDYPAETEIVAGSEYTAGWMHRLFFGDHYRDTWTTTVTVPYLDLDNTFDGLVPLKKGGGRQTKSLKFMGGDGMRYVLRSVNKDPIKALDYELRETIVADVVRDQTTTQQPYGAMAADILLNELGIYHAHPKLYVLPKDDKLGPYKEEYGNLFGMLEENPSNPDKGGKGYAGADEIIRSHKLFRKLYRDHKNRIDTRMFAIARCFDMLVGDWGKHEDNWKWLGFKDGENTTYYPMPRDRDHVFSRWDGILPWLADREWAKPSGENFGSKIVGLRSLMWQARHLDRFVAADLNRVDWIRAANFVQEKITNDVITQAVQNMPAEIYDLSGKVIEDKLRQRIKDLEGYAIEYYEMLAEEVDVVGSNEREYFKVIRNSDGSVQVTVSDTKTEDSDEPGDLQFYERTFVPEETDEIRLFGLDGRDIFDISGKSSESIPIRVIGGPSPDKIYDRSSGSKTLVYERNKKATVEEGDETSRIDPSDKTLYNYNRRAFVYNTYFPFPYLAYNVDKQFIVGFDLEFTIQKYGVKDYHIKHTIGVEVATALTLALGYELRQHHFIGKWDLSLGGSYANPNDFLFFYGIGNETKNEFEQDYYKTRFKSLRLKAGTIYDFWKKSAFSAFFRYDNNQEQLDKENTILADSAYFGTDKTNLAEIFLEADLDFRDNPGLPEDGMRLYLSHNNGFILTNDNSNYGKTLGFMEFFTTVWPFTLGLKGGGGGSYGDIPFYNQLTLGQNNYLRGFRNNRFTGKALAFFNSELRLQLFDVHTAFVPIKIGLKGFFDTGRIFQTGEDSKKWHNGYGFGIFIVPLEARYTFNLSAGFSEEESLLITFGFGSAFN